MSFEDLAKLLRARWITVVVTAVLTLLAAIAATMLTTPLYQASTKLYVSSTGGSSISESYQASRLSQDRVLSYTELLKGHTLAERTVDRLSLQISPGSLREKVTARSKPDTVLIDVSVRDTSPVRARDIANALSEEFVVMVRELETPRPGAQPDARVVVQQRAMIPGSPVVPNSQRNIAFGLALGLLLGAGLAVVRELLDNTVKDRDTLEALAGVGVVGVVPLDKARQTTPAITFATDNSGIAEAFRKLRTNLQFLSVDSPPRLIVVTSAVPNEGKTTTAINIALSLAEAEHSVLLVDADMRRPSLDKYLDLVGSVGLSTVLSGGASLSEVLQESAFPHLTVLTAGATPPNPSELLGSLTARNLLAELREKFDYVIIDNPPLLAVTDAAVLAAISDGTLMVVRYAATKREQISHALRSLEASGGSLLGAILTMAPTRRSASYSYDYYDYGYSDDASTAPGKTRRRLRRRKADSK
jgi:capsular exopolysaccharide synthesis family protein